jgi:MerR family transcriptional regulator, copper efflux regulator
MTATAATDAMRVGELSRRTGVSIKALRDYTDWGLIYTRGRSGANYRLYDDEALQCVQAITELRGLGLTLAEIRWLAARYPDQSGQLIGPLLAQRLRAARARIEAQITRLEQTRRRLDTFEAVHRDALAGRPGAEIWIGDAAQCESCA